jgi:1-deoxy-D-xylulose-5-phosphate synthase
VRTDLLRGIRRPADVRALPADRLDELAAEIRSVLVESVERCGGHLGPNLGVVELTIALHRVFDSPRDPIVWDTGHQAYVHKLLSGRLAGFERLRRAGGLSGYPSRAESEHDLMENSHASTALAYATGLARASGLRGEDGRTVVAVIGDGALTGGLGWEGLNNLATCTGPVVVVLNDNGRSYSPTVGGFAHHLRALRQGDAAGNLFTSLGLGYIGPVDGHSIPAMEDALRRARSFGRPVVVHAVTVKGRGHPPAEADAVDCLHALSVPAVPGKPLGPAWTDEFGAELLRLAEARPRLVALTAAMLHPTGLGPLAQAHPDRVIDVGIAEQCAVTSAAGLAIGGLHPVVCIYATFLNRAFDQVLMDVALHRLPVTFVLDRAGVTGEDGASHHGMWDLAAFSVVPGLRIAAPRDLSTMRALLGEAVDDETGPTLLRFPKGRAGGELPAVGRFAELDLLRIAPDAEVLLVGVGAGCAAAVAAADLLAREGVPATVADPGWVHPLPDSLVELAAAHRLVVTVEDGLRDGGVGGRLAHRLAETDAAIAVRVCGLPSDYLPHGARADLLAAAGVSADGVARTVLDWTNDVPVLVRSLVS